MSASIWLETLKGGPFDGLPAFSIRFEKDEDELDLGIALELLTSLRPPPMHLRITHAAGGNEIEPIARILAQANAFGMGTSVEIYGSVWPWMLDKLVGWRCLHTTDLCVPAPVEEIVFHTKEAPLLSKNAFPFHVLKTPIVWWDLGKKDIRSVPQNVRVWVPRRTVGVLLFPKEEE